MASLFNLLKNPDSFNIGLHTTPGREGGVTYNTTLSFGGPSKSIRWGDRKGESKPPSFHFLDRIEWYGKNSGPDKHEPTFLRGKDHSGKQLVDYMLRGGDSVNLDRRKQDYERINKFLYNSTQGSNFLLRQGALQLLNPQVNTRTFNGGVSLLATIMSAGVSSFKRSGAVPEPVGLDINSKIGDLFGDSKIGNFLSNVVGGGYLDAHFGGMNPRDINAGDPGKKQAGSTFNAVMDTLGLGDADILTDTFGGGSPRDKKFGYNVPLDNSPGYDQLNGLDIFTAANGIMPSHLPDDFIPFRFEVVDSDNPQSSHIMVFRAFIESFTDNYTANHNKMSYNGRGEYFYTYNKFDRKIQLGFKVAAQSRHEMKPLYKKLNYLVAQTAPNYSDFGRIRTPYMKVTVGDYLYRVPGVISNVGITWQKDYVWEVKQDKGSIDKDMLILPHALDVSLSFIPIHSFTPNNSQRVPFISINGRDGKGTTAPNWIDNISQITTTESEDVDEPSSSDNNTPNTTVVNSQ